MESVGIVGAGTVGTALAIRLSQKGYRVSAVASRTTESARRLARRVQTALVCSDAQGVANVSDLVFVTTPDGVIPTVVSSVKWRKGQSVLHCSGADSLDVLEPARKTGAQVGVFHPLQTFASVDQAIANLTGSTFALEADEPLLGRLRQMATDLGGHWVALKAGDKVLYHAAAVMACNYLVALLETGVRCYEKAGFARDDALQMMEPLVRETLDNVFRLGTVRALTGPVARGDHAVIARQLEALAGWEPRIAAIYRELGLAAVGLARQQAEVDAANLGEIERVLTGGK